MGGKSGNGDVLAKTESSSVPIALGNHRDFALRTGMTREMVITIRDTSRGMAQQAKFVQPFVIAGRGANSHLRLPHPQVSFRHVFLQYVNGSLHFFDLESRAGILHAGKSVASGQLSPGDTLQAGPFTLTLERDDDTSEIGDDAPPQGGNSSERGAPVRIWFTNGIDRQSQQPFRSFDRDVLLIGSSSRCHLRLIDPSVSRVHCALVRAGRTFWVVDLLGRHGTFVNSQAVEFGRIRNGDILEAGRFRLRIDCNPDDIDEDFVPPQAAGPSERPAPADIPATLERPAKSVEPSPPLPPLPPAPRTAELSPIASPLSRIVRNLPDRGEVSDGMLQVILDQFSLMQQQLLDHTNQQMLLLAQTFTELYKGQQDLLMEQFTKIQEITNELNLLKAQVAQQATDAVAPSMPGAGHLPGRKPLLPMHDSATAGSAPPAHESVPSALAANPPPSRIPSSGNAAGVPLAPEPGTRDRAEPVRPDLSRLQVTRPETIRPDQVRPEPARPVPGSAPPHTSGSTDRTAPVQPTDRQPRARATHEERVAAHDWLANRIRELERERSSRWSNLLKLLTGRRQR